MKNLTKTFQFLTIAAFLYVSIFALPMMATMHHHEGVPMSNCPFMIGEAALCEMNVLDHIASWQGMFAGLPPLENILFLLLALFVAYVITRFVHDPPDTSPPEYILYRTQPASLSFRVLLLGTTISPRAP